MVGPKKQDFWPKINILKGNHFTLRKQGAPVPQKLGMILVLKNYKQAAVVNIIKAKRPSIAVNISFTKICMKYNCIKRFENSYVCHSFILIF